MIIEYQYQINCLEDYKDRNLALKLLDLLGCNKNIVLFFSRTYTNFENTLKMFAEVVPCQILEDLSRHDRYCVFIPKINTNQLIFELIKANDVQTEIIYIPFVNDYETILYNRELLNKKSSVALKLSYFEANFDGDFGISFTFSLDHFQMQKINVETIINDWERLFENASFTKKIKKTI